MAIWDIKERNNLVRQSTERESLGHRGFMCAGQDEGDEDRIDMFNIPIGSSSVDFGNLTQLHDISSQPPIGDST